MSNKFFETDIEYRKQLLKELIDIVGELGWQVAIPEDIEEEEEVPGLIIGTSEYIDAVTIALEGGIDDMNFDFDEEDDGDFD